MPPAPTPRGRLKLDLDQQNDSLSSPGHESSNEVSYRSNFRAPPLRTKVARPRRSQKYSDLKDEDSESGDSSSVNHQKNPRTDAIAARPKDLSPTEAEASNPPPHPYPLSQQVFDLEKREQEAQGRCKILEKRCHELGLDMDRLTTARDKEISDYEAKCKRLEAANDIILKQFEKEKAKSKELHAKNESLVAELAALFKEKTLLAKMLEEKTHESWIFRCAITVVYKLNPSIRERVTMRDLLRDVLAYLWDKRQEERAGQEDQAQDLDNNDQVSDRVVEPPPQQGPCLFVYDTGELDPDSEDLPLSNTRKAQQKRPRATEEKDDAASNDDSDSDMPLFNVLKKKAKKLKTMSSPGGASSAG